MLSIRTQDRTSLVPYDSCISIYEVCKNKVEIVIQQYAKKPKEIEKLYEYSLVVGEIKFGLILGTYSTKERALEVLDEIEKAFIDRNVYLTSSGSDYVSQAYLPIVYQMPKE